jgi:hypothetical protein
MACVEYGIDTHRPEGHGIACLRWQRKTSSLNNISDSAEHIRIV